MNNKLRPCPLCGNKHLEVEPFYPYDGYQGESAIFVIICDCGLHLYAPTEQDVVTWWNTRAKEKDDEKRA